MDYVGPEHPLEVPTTVDEDMVQALSPYGPYEPLGERVRPRCPDRRSDDPDALRSEHLVEPSRVLGVPVPQEEPNARQPVLDGEVPGLLGDPRRVGVHGDAGHMDLPGRQLDEEEHVDRPKRDRLDGDRVMYPRHGAAVIEDLVELELFGKRRAYFKLRPVHGNLTIMVPVEETEELGVREVASRGEIDKALEVLRQEEGSTPSLWSQRYKANLAKLTGGDISQMGEVVRDLSLKERRKPLSAGEKRMLVTARDILVSELTFAFDSTEEKIEVMLDEVLQEALVGRSVSCAPVRAALHTRRGPQPGPVAASTKPDAGH